MTPCYQLEFNRCGAWYWLSGHNYDRASEALRALRACRWMADAGYALRAIDWRTGDVLAYAV